MNENRVDKTNVVVYKPTKPIRKISEAVYYYLLSLVPKGRLVTWDGLRDFVSKKLGVNIEFETRLEDQLSNIGFFSKMKDNRYKEVSSVGNTGWDAKDKLEAEGFELYKSTKYLYKVKDFKKYLFDFEKETNVSAEDLERIDREGLACLKNFKNCIIN
ncbi:MAG: hypothetical protein J6Y43_01480 [Clostridia bacterium]|nr:hypothetical protein [Clostridia bacterium]